ncbi:VOC family protein [Gracilibacillus kekensis]|uniref:Glyoxalase/Bleomycin resistance protein/Dioxygenase superfamily protein n=1 Tax=Gracilibacillus kekensis TaxID=1027249 RepID=A0A1M7L477_9BACI|nr:VOC family protein [Gracilibacillus kekensis]SHM72588.1 Glyoxalase/Bleomycin resistance protein/Dioxygenase superfamily protein [Gracilibacillus kekensis]
MSSNTLGSNVITQVAIIVKDIESVSDNYADFFGLDKPNIVTTDPYEKSETQYHSKPSEARAKLAFFDMGSLQLELIEPDEHPSTWREHLEEHGEGVHHIAFVVKGMNEVISKLETKNIPLIQKGEYEGGRYAYMDTQDPLKVMIELLEND